MEFGRVIPFQLTGQPGKPRDLAEEVEGALFQAVELALSSSNWVQVTCVVLYDGVESFDVEQVDGVLLYKPLYLVEYHLFQIGDDVGEVELFGGEEEGVTV